MIGPEAGNFMDEIDCGSFFDHIDDLLDFPTDYLDSTLPPTNAPVSSAINNSDDNSFPEFWPSHSDELPGSDSVFSSASASDLSAELSVPYEDIVQLEWLSNFVEESFSGGTLPGPANKAEDTASMKKEEDLSHHQFQTSSPVSVLESSSSCSGEKSVPRSPDAIVSSKTGRARSKRPRPTTFIPRPTMQLILPQPLVSPPKANSDSESIAESRPLLIKLPKQVVAEHKKKKKIKFTVPTPPGEGKQLDLLPQKAVRKCTHCDITTTPQWRAGPMGPKTLCNACGVRYKSGRLFPEYRPAASPTFIPLVHSNSHKKVLEMRSKAGDIIAKGVNTAMKSNPVELIPNNSSIAMEYIGVEKTS